MKNFLLVLLLIFLTMKIYSQTVDGQFVTNIVGSTYQVNIETNMQAGTGSAGIVAINFTFNSLGLSFPTSPVSGVDYIVQGGFAAYPTKNITSNSNTVSINLATFSTPVPLSTTPIPIIQVNFTIIDVAQLSLLSWTKTEIVPAFGSPVYTVGNWPNSDTPLPVELSSFTALANQNAVNLIWQTATEMNNYGFEIERKISNAGWTKIGFVNGNGNSNSPKNYNFSDQNLIGGSQFSYRLKQIDNDGQFEYSKVVEVKVVPTEFALHQNYPNPFNPNTTIRFQLASNSKVLMKIYNILGVEVTELLNDQMEAGIHEVEFNAESLASGTYIYRISAGSFVETRKMILLK